MSGSLASFPVCSSAVNSLRIMEGGRITYSHPHTSHVRTQLALQDSAYIPFFLVCSRRKSSLLPRESCTNPILPKLLSSKPSFSFLSRENLLWQKAAGVLATEYRGRESVPSHLRDREMQTGVVSQHQSSLTPVTVTEQPAAKTPAC